MGLAGTVFVNYGETNMPGMAIELEGIVLLLLVKNAIAAKGIERNCR